MVPLPDRPCPPPCACSWRPATSVRDGGTITHDAYQKALDRLLRDLRVEKA
jgi:hypothetical protein